MASFENPGLQLPAWMRTISLLCHQLKTEQLKPKRETDVNFKRKGKRQSEILMELDAKRGEI